MAADATGSANSAKRPGSPTWYHEDDICWIADCEICNVPMVVWRHHGTEPPAADLDHMRTDLGRVADEVLGAGGWSYDGVMRQIPDHFHCHARDPNWWASRASARPRRRADRLPCGRDVSPIGPTPVTDWAAGSTISGPRTPVVLGMARGGVPVAHQVASHLHAPLDVVLVRKLGHPAQPELGLGALGEDGVRVLNEPLLARLAVPPLRSTTMAAAETAELERRCVATGATVHLVPPGAGRSSWWTTAWPPVSPPWPPWSVRRRGAARIVLAVPVGSPEALALLEEVADSVVCLTAARFFGISQCYRDFPQVTDDEVTRLLARSPAGSKADVSVGSPPMAKRAPS